MEILIDNSKTIFNNVALKKIVLLQIIKKLKEENIITEYEYRMSSMEI